MAAEVCLLVSYRPLAHAGSLLPSVLQDASSAAQIIAEHESPASSCCTTALGLEIKSSGGCAVRNSDADAPPTSARLPTRNTPQRSDSRAERVIDAGLAGRRRVNAVDARGRTNAVHARAPPRRVAGRNHLAPHPPAPGPIGRHVRALRAERRRHGPWPDALPPGVPGRFI